ncbi:MAG: hypothetical protein A2V45_06930 [Candidatus Aminicenantes bacterium RBG_19FT_COMBO_58_17]|nr:MAG: hypothetical protein A2V45_06930 [Candidatus Aminicenantes bacterium RBG_19FT_COMBO_58_17]
MKISEVIFPARLNRLKYGAREVPHATVEPNRTCNGRCRHCYNLDRSSVKSLDLIREEVDKLRTRRRLQVISILGGEPTLHPQIAEIVRYIKSKGILCQLLTNGVSFLQRGGEALLRRLIDAGIDKIVLHVDRGQEHLAANADTARTALAEMMESAEVPFSLALTIEKGDEAEIPDIVRRYAEYRYFEGILGVLARDPLSQDGAKVEMEDAYDALCRMPGIRPCAYVPSCQADDDVDWLLYLYFIDSLDGTAVSLPPLWDLVFRKAYRAIKGRQPFVLVHHPFLTMLAAVSVITGDILAHPRKIPRGWRLMGDLFFHRSVRFHYVAIQNPPEFDPQEQRLRFCYQCPDATMRNGRLMPVCLADWISPLNGTLPPASLPEKVIQEVYHHLGEPG